MQNKKLKNQLQKDIRRMHERLGATVLILGTLAGTVAISQEARRLLSELAMRPAFAVIEHSGKENETARHPVRLDSVLRATPISGE
jgi:hypothetical protein